MSLEPGGRSDKYGNQYENRYLAKLLLRVISGQFKSIIVEPLGKDKDSVEFIATDINNIAFHYQCKASNSTQTYWRVCDLQSHNVFKRSQEIIESDIHNEYVFVSPLPYGELSELCKRAETHSSIDEFKYYQLNNTEIKRTFDDCAKYYGLDISNDEQCARLVYILSKCHFETVSNGIENKYSINELAGMYFTGNADEARLILENYVNSTGRFGVPLTADEIISFMNENGFIMRKNLYGESNVARISELNDIFCNAFQPINNTLIHRSETHNVLCNINEGKSIILHGKAGTGKSGCVHEIISELQNSKTLFLALKLDKLIPHTSSDHYGKDLGLTQSPVYCLHNIAAGKPCVLILDQLDALRWTSQHSASALDVCKELISQAHRLNEKDNGHISLVFISRTFDLENDSGLKALFSTQQENKMKWTKIQINPLSQKDVRKIIGEDYDLLSLKLQDMLLTPSSLYIWTALNNHSDMYDLTTPFELMEKWWKQITDKCTLIGNDIGRVNFLKDSIVKKMESTSSLALPEQLFADYTAELQALISNGLLIKNNNKIAFTHQSFFDYFAITDMLNEIYQGKSILELIGSTDNQTPNVRYRLLRLLQVVLDADENHYISICEELLNSDKVRHYFKCAVFEIAGQYEAPSDDFFNYIYGYFTNSPWHNHIYSTVYLSHAQYILNLDKHGPFDWLNEEGLNLLRSINTKEQDFVLKKLKPICFTSKENNKIVLDTISRDASYDSPEMLDIRLKLLETDPEYFSFFGNVSQLIKKQSPNVIPFLKLIIKMSDELNHHMHLGEKTTISQYVRSHYRELTNEILPEVCDKTKNYNENLPEYKYDEHYRKWTRSEYSESVAREIVEMLICSLCEFASDEPEQFISFIDTFNGHDSPIYYEMIAHAICSLNTDYSDAAILWLISDPTNHFFIYSYNSEDYLSLTKEIITKFSPYCSNESLEALEKLILKWSDPPERMINIYKRRIEVNRQQEYRPVYYAYWGHLQKELLPRIDKNRISSDAKNLLRVLNRNDWVRVPFYNQGWSSYSTSGITSPVSGKTIPDKTWLKIISTPSSKMNKHSCWKGTNIEANHHSFSQTLSSQAKHDPVRFAKLSLSFPNECYSGYITGVIRSLYDHDESIEKIDFALICNVINNFISHQNTEVVMEILRLIEKRAEENWPAEIINFVCDAAVNAPHPSANFSVHKNKSHNSTPYSLLTNAINCVRGCAIDTLSQLLWNHREFGELFKPFVRKTINDEHKAVRFHSVSCIFPYYVVDRDFCIDTLKELIQNEVSVLGHNSIWEIICRDYSNNSEFYSTNLLKACDSGIEELNERAAGFLCAITIYYDSALTNELYQRSLNEKQINRVCMQAAFSFNQEEHHQKSKEILLHYIEAEETEVFAFNRLFHDKCIDIDRDEDFVIKLINATRKAHRLHTILDYIIEQDQDITKYTNVLYNICQMVSTGKYGYDKEMVLTDLIKCIIKLLDRNKYNMDTKRQCLDMWDIIYQRSFDSVIPFTRLLDNIY